MTKTKVESNFYSIREIKINRVDSDNNIYSIIVKADVVDDGFNNIIGKDVILTANKCKLNNGLLKLIEKRFIEEVRLKGINNETLLSYPDITKTFNIQTNLDLELLVDTKDNTCCKLILNTNENLNIQEEYDDIIDEIEDKKQELKDLEDKKEKLKEIIWENRIKNIFNKNTITKDDIDFMFRNYYTLVSVEPYYNELSENKERAIIVLDGFRLNIFNLDKSNKIISALNIKEEIFNNLIGKYIDLFSFEDEQIRGTRVREIGWVESGEFNIYDEYK